MVMLSFFAALINSSSDDLATLVNFIPLLEYDKGRLSRFSGTYFSPT